MKRIGIWLGALAILGLSGTAMAAQPDAIEWTKTTFKPQRGEAVEAFEGSMTVPENRSDPQSRRITLNFIKFPSTNPNPGSPIVYLAGGPGGSGIRTAQWIRFPLFMALREVGDVIALDQRGTGRSNEIPICNTNMYFPLEKAGTREAYLDLMKKGEAYCTPFWKDEGVDLRGYTTLESARDLEDLRKALGTEKITLWGISYGTHLALAALKEMEGRIDKAVLASAEGLDQTVKLPARTDAYFDRVQAVIDQDPTAKARYPDVKGLIARVLKRVEDEPVSVEVAMGDGSETGTLKIGKFDLQILASFSVSDPRGVARLLGMFTLMDAGQFSDIGQFIFANLRGDSLEFRGMPEAMDVASGISAARLALVEQQAKTALLGDALNFPMPHMRGHFGVDDLGEDFRANVATDVPTLFLTGTLDGRTYPEGQREIMEGFENAQQIVVVNAGHNLFMVSPVVTERILGFLKTGTADQTPITIDPPAWQ